MSKWFWYQPNFGPAIRVQWLDHSPVNKAAFCDRCSKKVGSKEKRLRLDNGQGRVRKRGKGKNHQYICMACASNVPDTDRDQEQLF